MEKTSVRDLHLKTSALIKEVAKGQTYIIESRGVPVAELRPITEPRRIFEPEAAAAFPIASVYPDAPTHDRFRSHS